MSKKSKDRLRDPITSVPGLTFRAITVRFFSSYLSPFFLKTPCGGGALSLCCDMAESLPLLYPLLRVAGLPTR